MTAVAEMTIEQRVEAGAAWLDEHRPGWVDRIDLDRLDLASTCRCILGQEYGSFHRRPTFGPIDDKPETLGFDLTEDGDQEEEAAEYAALTDAWRDLIEQRRAGAAP